MVGVVGGIGAALAGMGAELTTAVLGQVSILMLAGGFAGSWIANSIQITELPQMVAAFHCLVGGAQIYLVGKL